MSFQFGRFKMLKSRVINFPCHCFSRGSFIAAFKFGIYPQVHKKARGVVKEFNVFRDPKAFFDEKEIVNARAKLRKLSQRK